MIFNEINDNKSEINIDDAIGFWGLTHQDFSNQLKELEGKDIQLNIASYGGVVSDAMAIYNSLKSHSGRITANIYGDSASAATFIAMAADEIRMADNVLFLVHNVQGMAVGDTEEMKKTIEIMDKMNTNIVNVYKKKTGLTASKVKKFMNNEEWWTAKEARDNGFIDKIVEPSEIVNREEAMVNCVDEKLKQKLVNKLNNNINQTTMAEEKKETSKVDALIEGMSKIFTAKVDAPEVIETVEEVVEDSFSKEDVDSIVNSAKENATKLTEANEVIVNAKDDEIAKLKADLEKATNTATVVEGANDSPEAEEKPVIVNAFLEKTSARLINKFKIN
jgi:ATP-dependent protease ClpP protease subunit